jgi:Protein of unknown function (DUF4446)
VTGLEIGLAAALVLMVAWQGSTNLRLNRTLRQFRQLSAGIEGQPLDQLLQKILDRSEIDSKTLARLEADLKELGTEVQTHIQNVGLVRYNAFNDTGGDQSYALALLDGHGDGALINGLFHRTECRVYVKPVQEWKSTHSMSDEESEAIRRAREGR